MPSTMDEFDCACGLPEENHKRPERALPPEFGIGYANEDYHYRLLRNNWSHPHVPMGDNLDEEDGSGAIVDEDGQISYLDSAHRLCNKTCAFFDVSIKGWGYGELFDRAYAAWFHHSKSVPRRGRFLLEPLDCRNLPGIRHLCLADLYDIQIAHVVETLLPVHKLLCDAVEQRLQQVTDEDKSRAEPDEDELWYYNLWDFVYTAETEFRAVDTVFTGDHYNLRDQFTFEASFKRFFIIFHGNDIEKHGITLVDRTNVRIEDFPGEGWVSDEGAGVRWLHASPGIVLEKLLELAGLPKSEHSDIMHGRQALWVEEREERKRRRERQKQSLPLSS